MIKKKFEINKNSKPGPGVRTRAWTVLSVLYNMHQPDAPAIRLVL